MNSICKRCNKPYDKDSRVGLMPYYSPYCSVTCKNNKRIPLTTNERIIKNIFRTYNKRAIDNNIEFTLTIDYFTKYYKSNCYYCNDILKAVAFDKIDPSKGYTEDNTVPCCVMCNMMKRNTPQDLFISHCKKITINSI